MDSVGWLCRVLVGWYQDRDGAPGGDEGYKDNKVQLQPMDDVSVLFWSHG